MGARQRHRAVRPVNPSAPEPETHSFAEGGYADVTSVAQGNYITFFISNKVNPFTVTIVNLANRIAKQAETAVGAVQVLKQQTDPLAGIGRINDSGVRILHAARALRKAAVGK